MPHRKVQTGLALAFLALVASGCGRSPGLANLASGQAWSAASRAGKGPAMVQPGQIPQGPTRLEAPWVLPEAGDAGILQAIAGAKREVRLMTYMLTHPGVIDGLIAAHGRGVATWVILEGRPYNPGAPNSPLPTNKKTFTRLTEAGVPVKWSSPTFRYTHAKTMIVDGAVAYVGTQNYTKSGLAFGGHGSREYILPTRDPQLVADLANLFGADWHGVSYQPTSPSLVASPINSRARLFQLIRSATKRLDIQVEVAGDPALDGALAERVRAGVQVRALLADLPKLGGKPKAKAAGLEAFSWGLPEARNASPVPGITLGPRGNAEVAEAWKAVGAQVRFQKVPHLHAKAIMVDGVRAYLGSINLTTNSMDNNRELGAIVAEPVLVAPLVRTFELDWAGSAAKPTAVESLGPLQWAPGLPLAWLEEGLGAPPP